MIVIGVDAGESGGVVVLSDGKIVELLPVKNKWKQVNALFEKYSTTVDRIVIEKVGAFSGQGVKSCFSFGFATGRAHQAALLASCPVELVTPHEWQRHFGLIVPKGEKLTKTQKKNLNKAMAEDISGVSLTHAVADAYLIALWGYESWKSRQSDKEQKPTHQTRKRTLIT